MLIAAQVVTTHRSESYRRPRRPAVARWARQTIELGHPGFRLTPLVISFADVPRITDRDAAASRLPQLAVLSAMAHPELEIAEVAIEAISQLPEDLLRLYTDVILKALPAEPRRRLEARMIKGYQYQSDFARKYYGQGIEEGRQAGREEGREEGLRSLRSHGPSSRPYPPRISRGSRPSPTYAS